MASIPSPTKPPRGIKSSKESSGHLMSIIRTLSASESNEQRDREKAKLEKEYNKSDQQLDELIQKHHEELSQVMQLFGQLSTRISTSKDKVRAVKENLLACKTLLSCRREELKKLWLEGVEHKHVLHLLDEIEQIKDALTQVSSHLSKKHYLHATNLIVSTLALGEGDLAGVEALKELKSELNSKKQKLVETLLDELSKYIYVDSTQEIVQLRRQGSGRDFGSAPQQKISLLKQSKAKKALEFSYALDNKVEDLNFLKERVTEDTSQEVEGDPIHFVAIILECLAILNKLPDTVEKLKVKMQAELFLLVRRTTEQLVPTMDSMTPQFALSELLQTLIEQFRRVVGAHQSVLNIMERTALLHNCHLIVYDFNDIWSRIQTVMQSFLSDYLDIQNTSSESQPAPNSFSEQALDISSYFNRRKPQRKEKPLLFKFDFASTLPKINSFVPEQLNNDFKIKLTGDPSHQEKVLICPPDPQNITVIFIPLMIFVEEIEQSVSSPCTLNVFVSNYVKGGFLRHHRNKVVNAMDVATKCSDAWRSITPPELAAQLNLSRPLLLSTVKVEQSISEIKSLMQSIPHHAQHFLSMIINILKSYREICQAAYRGIVQPESEDKTIYSVTWLKDEDITRLLKSLPNWEQLEGWWQSVSERHGHITREESIVEGPEDVQLRNEREAEILASNLGESGISQHEIISDVNQLKCLAQLQESMEWFAMQIIRFVNTQSHKPSSSHPNQKNETIPVIEINSESNVPRISSQLISSLEQLANEFQELANTCLLVLHLEVRVQCFHYLLPQGSMKHVSNSHDIDPRVSNFSRVLSSIDEAMTVSLQPRKCKYIFEGLGHMIAKLLISSAQLMEQIDKPSVHRMCRNIYSLQQTLTNITMTREIALDHARHYFELLFLSPEDVLNQIVEKGPEFSELEYMNALQLIHQSNSDQSDATIQGNLQKLSDILSNTPVRRLLSTTSLTSGVAV